MDSIWSFMDVIFVGAGLYACYAWFLMKTSGEIKTSLLMNKDVELRKCKNLEGYKAFISPRLLVFAVASILYGGAGLVNTYVFALPNAVYAAVMVLFFAVLVWFAMQARKGIRLFW